MRSPEWSPRGAYIAYRYPIADKQVYIARANGIGRRRLTPKNYEVLNHAWSPDGKTFALYGYGHPIDDTPTELTTMPATGGARTPFPNSEDLPGIRSLDWGPAPR